jgi:hypothetical protein
MLFSGHSSQNVRVGSLSSVLALANSLLRLEVSRYGERKGATSRPIENPQIKVRRCLIIINRTEKAGKLREFESDIPLSE